MGSPTTEGLDPTIGDEETADIAVDVQVDFCEGGSLAVEGGAGVAERGSAYAGASTSKVKVATRDLHIDPGDHFALAGTAPDFVDTWPAHCLAGTAGASFHRAFDTSPIQAVFSKGAHRAAYSGFEGRTEGGETLDEHLRARGVRRVKLWGIALSHCVAATALDAVAAGYEVVVLPDLTVGVSPETTEAALERLRAAGVRFVDSATGELVEA